VTLDHFNSLLKRLSIEPVKEGTVEVSADLWGTIFEKIVERIEKLESEVRADMKPGESSNRASLEW
jgi:hypothetical protein